MSILGRLAKGIGAAALTGNLSAGVVAAAGNNFTLGTLAGISDNLLNSAGLNYGMQQYGYNPYSNPYSNPYNNGGAITGCFGTGYDQGMNMGYNQMNTGYNQMNTGFNTGYNAGYNAGFNAGWDQFTPFNNGFNYNPMGYNMWTNPAIMW